MDLGLSGKHIVITGGSKGIGLAIVNGFLQEGAFVHVISRGIMNREDIRDITNYEAQIFEYHCDVTLEEELYVVFEAINKNANCMIDAVVANVGNGAGKTLPVTEKDEWDASWNINFNSSANTTRIFLNALKKSHGSLIFISSIAGEEFIGAPTSYSVAKHALLSFTKILSHRLAPEVRVNAIAPGNIYSEDGTWGKKKKENPSAVHHMLNEKVPLKRFGYPEEVAALVLFLTSEKASFITGSCINIDGGQTIRFS
ncbi:MAG: SDR family oxidoreductase [Bacteroidetes bacterium]|nr:SDR family oxidoreductase [Bacteroidota bacterium]